MAIAKDLDVQLIAATRFTPPADVAWAPEDQVADAESLVEFAGRACYETFDRPNPRTQTNDAYLRHIMEVGHHGLLEHATATMYIRGVSRAAAGEIMRHRHFSFSQLSQRFVHTGEAEIVLPEIVAQDEELTRLMKRAADETRFVYDELLDALEAKLADEPNALLRRKQARQAARAILPNATESRVVVTGNYRTWRHFIAVRATEHADVEIRTLAIACLRILQEQAPTLFSDFHVTELSDGSEMAVSSIVADL